MEYYHFISACRMDKEKIDHCIEALCNRGCREVTRTIGIMERHETLPETAALTPEEHAAVLHELQAIMAVYDKPCDI
jgi:hypothetical protein